MAACLKKVIKKTIIFINDISVENFLHGTNALLQIKITLFYSLALLNNSNLSWYESQIIKSKSNRMVL